MELVRELFIGFETFVLVYFAVVALLYALFGYLGMRSVVVYARELSDTALRDLIERDWYKPVSLLVPAYNEERSVVASVRSLLDLEHPQFEVVVAADGPTDGTVEVLTEAYALVEVPRSSRTTLATAPVRRVLRSLTDPNLIVVEKDNGGRADAINAAFNEARYPLVCVVDGDSILDGRALARASRMFTEDERVVAVGGTIRPLNGAVLADGKVVDLRAPRRWVERFQVLEYARAFFTARSAWSRINTLMIISGAFGIFRREAVEAVGGWWPGTVADDMELVIRLHKHHRRLRLPYRIAFAPDPICWTEVPSSFRALRRQRAGWQRGITEALWRHRGMALNPRYGRVGLFGIPYLWVFEVAAPYVEAAGYLYIVLAAALGVLNVEFAVAFLALAVLYAVLLSELAMGVETLLLDRYQRARDRLVLFAAAFVEFVGFRQLLVFARAWAGLRVRSQRGRYWTEERTGIDTAPPARGGAAR